MQVVLASQNPHKRRELAEILADSGVTLVLPEELGVHLAVEETGATFAENAALKAEVLCRATGLPAIADDSGLEVQALHGEPGVYSARYGGPGLDDAGRCQKLLERMAGERERSCRFVCVICCAFPDRASIFSRGECPGRLAEMPAGSEGFGYDPIFYLTEKNCTMAQLSAAEKNAISHRGRALAEFAKKWKESGYGTDA